MSKRKKIIAIMIVIAVVLLVGLFWIWHLEKICGKGDSKGKYRRV